MQAYTNLFSDMADKIADVYLNDAPKALEQIADILSAVRAVSNNVPEEVDALVVAEDDLRAVIEEVVEMIDDGIADCEESTLLRFDDQVLPELERILEALRCELTA